MTAKMILFFETPSKSIIAAGTTRELSEDEISRLLWLFSDARLISSETVTGTFIGPVARW